MSKFNLQNKRIIIDMDETVADSLGRHIEWYQRDFGIKVERSETVGKKFYDFVPEDHRPTVKNYPFHPDFFRDLDLFDDAVETIRQLAQQNEIFFATAAMEFPQSFTAKYDWLRKHFDFIDPFHYIFCGHKSVLYGDYLIDDTPHHLDSFCGRGILFHAEHNTFADGYDRIKSWKELL